MADIDRSTCTAIKHGTDNAYNNYRCRCEDGRAAHAAVKLARHHAKKSGVEYRVDAVSTKRKLRALMALGWSGEELSRHLGGGGRHTVNNVLNRQRVTPGTRDRVSALYDALQNVPGPSVGTRRHGQSHGWAPPFAWDPETINDPLSEPDCGGRTRGWLPAKELMYEYQQIRESGMTHAYALKELGIKHDAWEVAKKRTEAA